MDERRTQLCVVDLLKCDKAFLMFALNLLPNDLYISRTAPLTSKHCILYTYSTNVFTGYFKHALYSQFFPLQNAVCFIMLTSLIPLVFTFYIQGVLKLKKNNSGAKGLKTRRNLLYIRNRSVPRCKHFPPRLFKDQT